MTSKGQTVSSKLVKTRVLLGSKTLAGHVPATRRLTRSSLLDMLSRYGMVYVKPDTGSLGIGVMRVEKRRGEWRVQSGVRSFGYRSFSGMYRALLERAGGRRYLVQRGIHVLKRDGRPFDFRVMIQRTPEGGWETTGIAGRVADSRKVVTNGSQGGTIYAAAELLKPAAGDDQAAVIQKKLERLAEMTAASFSRVYPAMNELGLDIAVDRNLAPWILEVNTRPDPCPFTKLADPSSIERIVACAKAYGRVYNLRCVKARKGTQG